MDNNIALCPICGQIHSGACPAVSLHDEHHHHHHHHDHDHHHHHHDHAHCHEHEHDEHGHCLCHSHAAQSHDGFMRRYAMEMLSLALMLLGLAMGYYGLFAYSWLELAFFIVAVLPVAWDIIKETLTLWAKGDVMNEFSLMLLAAIGAFAIGEYPEAVAVLLFYSFGEKLQGQASDDVRNRIRSLINKLPNSVRVASPDGSLSEIAPEKVEVGSVVVVRPGERVGIDGVLLTEGNVDIDTSAITGESVPRSYAGGEEISAGVIPIDKEIRLRTSRAFADSTMSRMMQMIDEGASAKTPTETMLRKITRWFTPTVVLLAAAVFVVPMLVSLITGTGFDAIMWLRRSLVFLVCSCPCALIVSIPLSYFASLGNGARRGLLFKGASHVDTFRNIDTMVLDKTGTITTGKFHVAAVDAADVATVLSYAAAIDAHSNHPLAKAIVAEAKTFPDAADIVTIDHGMRGKVGGKTLLVGSRKLMEANGIKVAAKPRNMSEVCVAADGEFLGSIFLEDTIKAEAKESFAALHQLGIKEIVVLSGDRREAVAKVAAAVGVDTYRAELLPEDKYAAIETLKQQGRKVGFVGDGINDAPSIARADVGIAMGTLGTDMAMESADVVIAGDNLTKLSEAVRLSRKSRRVVMENVAFAFGIKGIVMILAAFGVATLWAGVFADTGVTLITILWTLLRLRK